MKSIPQLPENFRTMVHVTAEGKITGNYWDNISAFEQRKTNEKITREDAERLAAVQAS